MGKRLLTNCTVIIGNLLDGINTTDQPRQFGSVNIPGLICFGCTRLGMNLASLLSVSKVAALFMHTKDCQGFGPESSCNLILLNNAERHAVQRQTTMLPDKHPEHAAKQQEIGYRTKKQTFHSYNRHTIHNIRNLKKCTECSCTGCPVIDCTVAQPAPAHCDASQVSCRQTPAPASEWYM